MAGILTFLNLNAAFGRPKQSDGYSLTAESSESSTLNPAVADFVATAEGAENACVEIGLTAAELQDSR
jgi:hypothetical protein